MENVSNHSSKILKTNVSHKFLAAYFAENQMFIRFCHVLNTNGQNMIIGQSLGGLLATEILMTKPEMFNDYIIVSPSLWWDKEKMVNKSPGYFKENTSLNKRVFVSLGKEHPLMHKVADLLVNSMQSSGNENLKVKYEPILDEDHATILHLAVYKANGWELNKTDYKPLFRANFTNPTPFLAPVLLIKFLRWVSTVFVEINNFSAISCVVNSSTISFKMSFSLGVRRTTLSSKGVR